MGSHSIVTGVCDLCGNEKQMAYKTYLICERKQGYYCCKMCANIKNKKTVNDRYGVDNVFQLESTKDKIEKTNLKRYGQTHHYKSEDFKKEYLYGEKNPAYSNSEFKYSNNSELKKWRKRIKDIYNNECFVCNGIECLEAHHIYSIKNNTDFIYELDNGVLLCRKCHKDFHKQYGYGDNTFLQFVNYVSNNDVSTSNAIFKDVRGEHA